MAGGHRHSLYVERSSPVHRLPPEVKVLATVLFILAVVFTRREAFWAFAVDAAIIVAIALTGHLSLLWLAKRLLFELPFLLFAFFLPFVGGGEHVDVGPFSLSVAGLWGAWNILVKGSLGVAATSVLAGTTSPPQLLRGLHRLHMPNVLVSITTFMIRYLEVIADDMRRMRIARLARGYDPRWFWQVKAVATSAGALFIRSYERGERVYVAMLSRGYDGSLPDHDANRASRRDWLVALIVPMLATVVCAATILTA